MRLCSNTACDNDQKKTKPPYNLHATQYFLTGQAVHVQLILHCKQFVKGMRSSIKFELNYEIAHTTVMNFKHINCIEAKQRLNHIKKISVNNQRHMTR